MGASNSALRRVYTVGMLIILLLIVSGWFFRFVQERIKAVDLRYHVFCEQIKPGMGQLEMRDSLSRFGDYIETNSGFKGGLEVVYITYKDPAEFHKFGGSSVVLRFVSGKYVDAFVPVPFSDANKSVCR